MLQKLYYKFRKINWKQGGGEILSFICILPAIVFVFCCFIASAQISMVQQTLEYTAYSACRAAVVSENISLANERANKVADDIVYPSTGGIVKNSVTVDISILDDSQVWEKGNFVECTVSADVTTILPFNSGTRQSSIVMMIERPASN